MARRKKEKQVKEVAPVAPPAAPEVPPAPPTIHPIAEITLHTWTADFVLGSTIDIASYHLICQSCIEYEMTLKQLAVFAVAGQTQEYMKMFARLQNDIRQRETLITNVLNTALSNKIAQANAAAEAAKESKKAKRKKRK